MWILHTMTVDCHTAFLVDISKSLGFHGGWMISLHMFGVHDNPSQGDVSNCRLVDLILSSQYSTIPLETPHLICYHMLDEIGTSAHQRR